MLLRYMYRVMTRKMSPVGPTVRYMASARLYSSLLLYKSKYNIKKQASTEVPACYPHLNLERNVI